MTDARPSLSVMFATIRGWPAARLPIDTTREQLERVGGEMIVLDGSGLSRPEPGEVGPAVKWISRPGESVFQMRAAGYAQCRGDIIAVTEDHCAPAPDWCDRILAAHAEHPEAIAIGGAVENGSPDHLVDWATFIVTQGPFVGPLASGPADRISGAATVTYKRVALDRRPDHGALGVIELLDSGAMRQPGEVLLNDDSIVVSHHQSMGVRGTAASQFHNGRTIAGFRRNAKTRGDWLRIVGFPVVPIFRTARTIRVAWGKRIPRALLVTTLPMMTFLHYCQATGEVIGYVAGPGSSPRRLR